MTIRLTSGEIGHHIFSDLPKLLQPSDLLVVNETRVTPALLIGRKSSGGRVELLVLDPTREPDGYQSETSTTRTCMVRSSKPLRTGTEVEIGDCPPLKAEETLSQGRARMRFPVPEDEFPGFLETFGLPPLPPYIRPEGRNAGRDRVRYQTVYAREAGSVAAPTAGLHFTEDLLRELKARGIQIARIVLHIGPGTFTPIRRQDIRLHQMDLEHYEIPEEAARLIERARGENRRTIAVGTTAVRALEASASGGEVLRPGPGSTRLFIKPGYSFKVVKGLLTNFHLPGSTLLVLVCSFTGTTRILNAYEEAVKKKYRFYSYGDACLILD